MTTAVDPGRSGAAIELEAPGLVSDCRLMLSFARKNSFVLPPPLLHEIAWIDSVLRALEIAPISQVAPVLIWPIDLASGAPVHVAEHGDAATAAAPGMTPEEVILDIHSRLSLLIAPTTSLSLQTSEPPAGKRHIFGGMPPLVQYVIVIAFISAICFVISATKIASKAANTKAAAATASAAQASFVAASAAAASMSAPAAPRPASGATP
jgi:hypothetical protein